MEFENDTIFICANQFVPIQADRYAHDQILVICTNIDNKLLMGIVYNTVHTGLTLRSCAVFRIMPMCILLSF
jgi:hypothetical protein